MTDPDPVDLPELRRLAEAAKDEPVAFFAYWEATRPDVVLALLDRIDALEAEWEPMVEWCRKCRDELPYGAPVVRAEFIPWGRYFGRDELVGPCCAMHLPKCVDLGRIDQYAVTDLRSLYRLADPGAVAGEPESEGTSGG